MLDNIREVEIKDISYKTREFSQDEKDHIVSLTDSINTQGLLHPLTVEEVVVDSDKKGYHLKAGLKRLLACKNVGKMSVMCLVLPADMSEEKKKETHLHENLFRFNLPWYEEVVLQKELFLLRQEQKGAGRQGKKVGFSLRDLADELDVGLGTVSENMRLADAVLLNPNLKKINDKITAKRLIFQESKRVEAEQAAGLPTQIEVNTTYNGNSAEILKMLPDNTFDGCITDPPWLDFKIESLRKDDQTLLVFKELYRVMKPGSFLYMFVSTPDFIIYQQELPKFGWTVDQMPLLWIKKNHISHGLKGWQYARDYEPILLAVKGNPVLTTSGQLSAVFTYPLVHPSRAIHPNEKPVELIEHIMGHCSYDGSLLIEPFGGSGVLAEACIRQNRRYVLIERDHTFFMNINKRIENVHSVNKPEAK